jgi:hypothetical protein
MSSLREDMESGAWLRPENPVRLIAAILLSGPIVGAIFAVVLAYTSMPDVIFMSAHPEQDSVFVKADFGGVVANTLGVGLLGAFMGGLFGLPATLVFAMPAHAWLVRKTRAGIFWYLGLGVLAGAAASSVYAASLRAGAASGATLLAYGVCIGAVAGCAFWMIRRPDKLAAKLASASTTQSA